jgi:hypothetical protein
MMAATATATVLMPFANPDYSEAFFSMPSKFFWEAFITTLLFI